MKRISNLLFGITALLIIAVCVNAQTLKPSDILLDGSSVLSEFGVGTELTKTVSGTLPDVTAVANVGQSLKITQPVDNGKGIVIVRDNASGNETTYTIHFVKDAPKTTLSGIQFGAQSLTLTPGVYDYNFALPAGSTVIPSPVNYVFDETEPVKLSAISTQVTKTDFADGGTAFVNVSAVDAQTHNYVFHFTVEPFNDANLGDIKVNGVSHLSDFTLNSSGEYEFDTDHTPISSVECVKAAPSQIVRYIKKSPELWKIEVEAQDGSKIIYNIMYGPQLSSELGVSVVIDGTTYSFDPVNKSASITLPAGVNDFPVLTGDPLPSDPAEVVFVSYRPDLNQIIISVEAENGDKADYTIDIITTPANDATLSNVEIDGIDYTFFNASQFDYIYAGTHSITGYTKYSTLSNVVLLQCDTLAELIVTAPDKTQNTYRFHFIGGGADASIVSTTPAALYPYSGLGTAPDISAVIDGEGYFVLQQGTAGSDVIAFKGVGPMSPATHLDADYTKSSESKLDELKVYHASSSAWESVAALYHDGTVMPCPFYLDNARAELPAIFAKPANDAAKVKINYDFLNHKAYIRVEAEDFDAMTPPYDTHFTEYSIEYGYNVSTENKLGSLTIAGEVKDVDKSDFTVNVDAVLPAINWTRAENTQIVNVVDNDYDGMVISVVPESGVKRDYNITYAATGLSAMSDNVLKSLSINSVAQDLSVLAATGNNEVSVANQNITTDLDLAFTKNYNSQIVIVTNYGGYKDGLGNLQVSSISVFGGEYEQKYNIPVNSVASAPVNYGATDFELWIEGVDESANIIGSEYVYPCKYGTLSMPNVEIKSKANGQVFNVEMAKLTASQLPNRIPGNYNKLTITVTNGSATKIFDVKFVKSSGLGSDVDLTSMTINGISYPLADGAIYDLAENYVPFVEFEKKAGQVVNMTLTKVSEMQYTLVFDITSADKLSNQVYTMTLNLPYDDSEGRLNDISGLKGFVNTSDGGIYSEDFTGDWPQWNFARKVAYDAVEQTISANQVEWVVSGKGGKSQTYTVNYTLTSTETGLESILVDGAAITVADKMSIDASSLPTVVRVNIKEEGQTLEVSKADDVYSIVVTAPDGITKHTYELTVNRQKSSVATLKDLAYATGMNNAYDAELTVYEANGTPNTPKWLAAEVEDMSALYSNGQKVEFSYSDFSGGTPAVQKFKVTSEDENNDLTYEIRVTNKQSSWAYLENIAVNGKAVPGFDPMTYNYDITSEPLTGDPIVTYSTLDAYQDVNITVTETLISIKVTADDNSDTHTYEIAVAHAAGEADVTLSELLINNVDEYTGGNISYNLGAHDQLPDIQPVAKYEGQTISVVSDNDKAEVTVTSPNGISTPGVYVISYNRVADNDVNVKAIMVDSLPEWIEPSTFNHDVVRNTVDAAVIDVLPANKYQTVTVSPIASGFEVEVVAPSGLSAKYTLNTTFASALTNDALLAGLEVDNAVPVIDVDKQFTYIVSGCYAEPIGDIRAILKNQYQQLSWNTEVNGLPEDENAEVTASVTSGNGLNTQDYLIIFKKDNSANLSDILIDAATLDPSDPIFPSDKVFSASETDYTVYFPSHAAAAPAVEFIEGNACQTVGAPVKVVDTNDEIKWECTVTAIDGLTTKTYSVDLLRQECDINTLSSITIDFGGGNIQKMEDGVHAYTAYNTSGDIAMTKSYTVNFNVFQTSWPGILYELTCKEGHETAVVNTITETTLTATYEIVTTAQNGSHETYTIIFNNYFEDTWNWLSQIFVDTMANSTTYPVATTHPYYTVDHNFNPSDIGPYLIEMHIDHDEDTLLSNRWPQVSWIAPKPEFVTVDTLRHTPTAYSDYVDQMFDLTVIPLDYPVTDKVTYQLQFRNPVCDVKNLKQIYLNGLPLSVAPSNYQSDADFDPLVTEYHITMPEGWTKNELPVVTYDSACRREKITYKEWEFTVKGGNDTIAATYVIKTQSQKGNSETYRLIFNYNKAVSTDLCMIYLDLGDGAKELNTANFTIAEGDFAPAKYIYTVDLEKCQDFPTLTYDLLPCNQYASAVLNESEFGNTKTFTITVNAQDKSVVPVDYVVTVNKTPTDAADAQLSMITLNGYNLQASALPASLVTGISGDFDPAVTTYTVNLPIGGSFPTVGYTKADASQVVTDPATTGDDFNKTTTVEVTTCDGKGNVTYTINFVRERSTVGALDLLVNGKPYDGGLGVPYEGVPPTVFEPSMSSYFLTYPSSYTLGFPTIEIKIDPSAKITKQSVDDSNPLQHVYKFTVTPEDASAEKEYIVTVYMKRETDAALTGITAAGNLLSTSDPTYPADNDWDPATFNYNIVLPPHTTVFPVIEHQFDANKYQTIVESHDWTADKHVDTYTVTSQRGDATNKYVVTTSVDDCDLHMLDKLQIDNGGSLVDLLGSLSDVNPADNIWESTLSIADCSFDLSNLSSKIKPVLECAFGDEQIDITYNFPELPVVPDVPAVYYGDVTINLVGGKGSKGQYVLHIEKASSDNVNLSSISLVRGAEVVELNNAALASSSSMSALTVDNDFDPSQREYVVTLPVGDSLNIPAVQYAEVAGECQNVISTGVVEISNFEYVENITVTPDYQHPAVLPAEYKVTFKVTPNTENRLDHLYLDGVLYGETSDYTAVPAAFDPDVNYYQVTYPIGISGVPVEVVAVPKEGAKVKSLTYVDATLQRTYTIVVTSETGNDNTYTLVVNYQEANDATLSGIFAEGELLSETGVLFQANHDFMPDWYNYSIDLQPHTATFPEITYKVNDPYATAVDNVTGTNADDVQTHVITVTAGNGATKDYNVVLNKLSCQYKYLTAIKFNNVPVAGFVKTKSDYTITRTKDDPFPPVESDFTWQQECPQNMQNVTVSYVDNGSFQRIFTIVSASHEDPFNSFTYIITVNWESNDDLTLAGIYADGELLSTSGPKYFWNYDFSNAQVNYSTTLDKHSNVVPVITAVMNSPYAVWDTASVWTADKMSRTTTLTAKANKVDVSGKQYFVTVNYQCTRAHLEGIYNNGAMLTGFDREVFNYDVNLPIGSKLADVNITFDKECDEHEIVDVQKVEVNPLYWKYTLTTKSLSGAGLVYTVNLYLASDNNAFLQDIQVGPTPISLNSLSIADANYKSTADFVQTTYNYTVTVAHHLAQPQVQPILVDAGLQTVATDMKSSNNDSTRVYTFDVTANDGMTKKTYTVTVNLTKCSLNHIESISLWGDVVSYQPTFDRDIFDYEVTLQLNSTFADFDVNVGQLECHDGHEKVTKTDWADANPFIHWYRLTTVPQAGISLNYTFKVTIMTSDNAELKDIRVNGATLANTPDYTVSDLFSSSIHNYTVTVDADAAYPPTVTAILADPVTQQLSENSVTNKDGSIHYEFVVTAGDQQHKSTYTVDVLRNLCAKDKLSAVYANGQPISGFNSLQYNYTFTLPKGVTTFPAVTYDLECANHETATMTTVDAASSRTYTITTKAENGNSQVYVITYNIFIDNNADLLDIRVNGATLANTSVYTVSSTFNPTITNYTILVDADAAYPPTVDAILVDPTSQQLSKDMITNSDGSIHYTFIVTASDKVTVKTYTVDMSHAKCDKNRLAAIYENGMLISGFNSLQYNYTFTLPNGVTTFPAVTYDLECANHETATMTTVDAASSRTYTITTKAENGNSQVYVITYNIFTDNNADLLDIRVNGATLANTSVYTVSSTFSPTITNYTILVDADAAYPPTVDAILVDPTSQQLSKDMITNSDGSIHYTFIVTASDKVTVKTYTVDMSHAKCDKNRLAAIYENGMLISGFNPAVNTYAFTLPIGTVTFPTVTYDLECVNHETAVINTVTGNGGLLSTTTITTKAEDGSSQTYSVTYTIAQSDNADLSMIYTQGLKLECLTGCDIIVDKSFTAGNTTYNVSLPYGAALAVADITADVADPKATYSVVSTSTGFNIVVTAEDGTVKTYELIVTNRPSDAISLLGISVDYTPVQGFDPNVFAYTVPMAHKDHNWILNTMDISAVVSDPNIMSWTEIKREYVADSTYRSVIRVTAQDVNVYTDYTITITNSLSHNAYLHDLRIDGVSIAEFDSTHLSYVDTLDNGMPMPVVSYIGSEPYYQTYSQVDALSVTDKTYITVTAEDGITVNTYVISYVYREKSSDALLDTIIIHDGAVLQPVFDSLTFSYIAVYPASTDPDIVPAHLTYHTRDPHAVATVNWAAHVGETTTILVTAEDGTQQTYTVVYTIEGSGLATLCDLGFLGDGSVAHFDEGTIDDFEPENYDYNISLENASVKYLMDESAVQVIAVPCDPNATIESITRTAVGTNDVMVQVTVRAADLVTTAVYTVNVHIIPSGNGYLDMIIINGDSLTSDACDADFVVTPLFQPEQLTYEIAVAEGVTFDGNWNYDFVFGNAQQEIMNIATNYFGEEIIQIITVKAGNGTLVNYTLRFIQKTGYAYLEELYYNGILINDWYPEGDVFSVYCSYGKLSTFSADLVTYVRDNERQKVDVQQISETQVLVTVTADDCSQHTYTLQIIELAENSSLLSDLLVDDKTVTDFQPRSFYYDYYLLNGTDVLPNSLIGVPFDPMATVVYDTVPGENGVWVNITVTDLAGGESEYIIYFQPVPYDVNSRAEVWDVGVVHMGGNTYKVASHKTGVTFAVYDSRGYLQQIVSVPLIDPNMSVDDPAAPGKEVIIDSEKLWIYSFYQNGKYRIERGKLMHF